MKYLRNNKNAVGQGRNGAALAETLLAGAWVLILVYLLVSRDYLIYLPAKQEIFLYLLLAFFVLVTWQAARNILKPAYRPSYRKLLVFAIPICFFLMPKPSLTSSTFSANVLGLDSLARLDVSGGENQPGMNTDKASNRYPGDTRFRGENQLVQDKDAVQAPNFGTDPDGTSGEKNGSYLSAEPDTADSDKNLDDDPYGFRSGGSVIGETSPSETIRISDERYLAWFIELAENPDKYVGQGLELLAFISPAAPEPYQNRDQSSGSATGQTSDSDRGNSAAQENSDQNSVSAPEFNASRLVMVCCANDMLVLELQVSNPSGLELTAGQYYILKGILAPAQAKKAENAINLSLCLNLESAEAVKPPMPEYILPIFY